MKHSAFLLTALAAASAQAQALPDGFVRTVEADGFNQPVALEYTRDGRDLFVAEKRGVVWIVRDGERLPQPVIDLSDEAGDAGDRGFLGMALHPEFARNGLVFFLYVVDPVYGAPDEPSVTASFGRLVRYRVVDGRADPGSRTVLLGEGPDTGFPHCHSSHAIGSIRFAPDGSLFAGSGDGAHYDLVDYGQDTTEYDPRCAELFGAGHDVGAWRSQLPDSPGGKILRLDVGGDLALGIPGNPYFTGDPADVASMVWADGLRNPFRFRVRPSNGRLYIGDVGHGTWEEINVARGGENFGWPCREGPDRWPAYWDAGDRCQQLDEGALVRGILEFHHWEPRGHGLMANALGGIAFYEGRSYPARFRGAMFFADYGQRWIHAARVDANDRVTEVIPFATEMGSPVDLATDPRNGDLVYPSLWEGAVFRIRYPDGENLPPVAVASADPVSGAAPLRVRFTGSASADPDGDELTFRWDFGDGEGSDEADPVHV
jgi:glucose/arabinose dehydrogenase